MSLPADELESLLSAAGDLQLSLLTSKEDVSIQGQQEWQQGSPRGVGEPEHDLNTDVETKIGKKISKPLPVDALQLSLLTSKENVSIQGEPLYTYRVIVLHK